MLPIILLVVAVVLVLWLVGAYNGLIALKNQVVNAWKQIDVQLKRRHDLIPNLINAVKGAMDFEKSTLEAVIQARNQAVKIAGETTPTGGVKKLAAAEAQLMSAMSRFNVVVEQYPQLKATANHPAQRSFSFAPRGLTLGERPICRRIRRACTPTPTQ